MINTHKNIVWWNNALFCTTSYAPFYGAMTDSILYFNFRHLSTQWYISPNDWHDHLPSGGLFNMCQNLHVLFHRLLSAAWGPPLLIKQHEGQKLPGYQPHPNVEILLLKHEEANIRMFHISSFWLNNLWTSLIPSGKSLSQQSFRLLDSSLSTDTLIFTTNTYAV